MSGGEAPKGNGVSAVFGRLEDNLMGIIRRGEEERSARVLQEIIGKPTPRSTMVVNGHTVQEYIGPGGKMTGVPRIGLDSPNLDEFAYHRLAREAARLPQPVHKAILQIYNERMTADERALWLENPFDKLSPSERQSWQAGFKAHQIEMSPDLFAVVVDMNTEHPGLKRRYFEVNGRPVPEDMLSQALPAPKTAKPNGAT